MPPVSGFCLAGSPAWHGLPQCPGYGHWASYCCAALVFGSGFCGHPANVGCGLGCLCLGTGFDFAPPILAGVCGMCVWAWLFLHPAIPGWGVEVCVCARLSHYPDIPAWGLCCVCSSTRVGFNRQFAAGVCRVSVCPLVWVLSSSRHSCWSVGVCVLVCALRLYPALLGWNARCLCVCLGWGFGCAPPLLAWVLGCVCLCARSVCTPPILAGVRGVCVSVQSLAFIPPNLAEVLGRVCLCAGSACR